MGDGGLIAQFTDVATGTTIAVSNDAWRCLLTHDAPLDRACEDESEQSSRGVGECFNGKGAEIAVCACNSSSSSGYW